MSARVVRSRWVRWLVAAAAAGVLGAAGAWLAITLLDYGMHVFLWLPLAQGFLAGFLTGSWGGRAWEGVIAVLGSLVIAACLLLGSAMEGVICLAMAAPLALMAAVAGSLFGAAVARHRAPRPAAGLALLPVVALALTGGNPPAPKIHSVTTSVVIDAPPEDVWPNVVGFSDLPQPDEWFFRAGIAHPLRAEIDGEGVGAVRRCVFSTGPFIEPITTWDPPRRLAFDVTACPAPMRELSFRHVDAPHLHGFMSSQRGEFRLEELPDGRTRLHGTTWYAHGLRPETYWTWWSDAIIHRIHLRVLRHVESLSEATPS